MKRNNYNGILEDLIKGKLKHPKKNNILKIPIKDIQILSSTDGLELDLIKNIHPNEKILLISDENTRDVLGKRIFNNLSKKIDVKEYIWQNPSSSIQGIKKIQKISKDYSVLIAIGSGTISDTVKYVTFLDNKKFSIFSTSPMNAYTSPTASISFNGIKKSIYTHSASGVYFDMSVIAKAPTRLIRSAFSDVICRTTSQFDWMLSNRILSTNYDDIPYFLLNFYEKDLLKKAKNINNHDLDSLVLLTRIAAIMGLSTFFIGSTHYGSMAEHSISHFLDKFLKDKHPGTSHGEQVGLATLSVSKLQNSIINLRNPPKLFPTKIPDKIIIENFGEETLNLVKKEMKNKILDSKKINIINSFIEKNWIELTSDLKKIMINYDDLWNIMGKYGAIRTVEEAKIDKKFFNKAIRFSRFMRDRYTILDFADDSNLLEKYIV